MSSLYIVLRKQVKSWIYSSNISSWRGQEDDLAEDIVQEAITRTFEHIRQVELGEAKPVASLKAFSRTIAHNYYQDLRRRDFRLVRPEQDSSSPVIPDFVSESVDPAEVALNNVFTEWLFVRLSLEILKFPRKRRTALLVDLASSMYFDTEPTPLQQAFLNVGIQLQEYQRTLSDDPVEQSRRASLLNLARKQLKKLACNPQYDPVA